MEFVRLAIVYAHLIACCVAIGLVLTQDGAMVGRLLKGDAVHHDERRLQTLHHTLTVALAVLWLTGLTLISLDIRAQGVDVLFNPKLQAKILVVSILTLNGGALHRWVIPAMRAAGSLLDLRFGPRTLAAFTGALSGVSWFYAAMLGVGRSLSWHFPVSTLLQPYVPLVVGGGVGMLLVMAWAEFRRRSMLKMFDDFAHAAR